MLKRAQNGILCGTTSYHEKTHFKFKIITDVRFSVEKWTFWHANDAFASNFKING